MLSFERKRDARIIRRFGKGGTAVLRKQSNIRTRQLRLSGAVLAGAVTLTASAANLSGSVASGAQFTLQGVSGTFTVSSKATSASGSVELTFSPALPSGAADGSTLSFTREYGETTFSRMYGSQNLDEVKEVAGGTRVLVLAWREGPEPENGDTLDGLLITNVQPIGSGGVSRWRVTVKVKP